MTSLFSRLQKLNKEATPGPWIRRRWTSDCVAPDPDERYVHLVRIGHYEPAVAAEDAALIVECRNSLPAVLNLIEAAERVTHLQSREDLTDARFALAEALSPFREST